jgi:hypothetical protein
MKESHGEDLASHTDPESCAVPRKGGCEALTGACAGEPLSRVIGYVRGADAVTMSGRLHLMLRYGKRYRDPARSVDPLHAQKLLTREPGDPVFARQRWHDGTHWEV